MGGCIRSLFKGNYLAEAEIREEGRPKKEITGTLAVESGASQEERGAKEGHDDTPPTRACCCSCHYHPDCKELHPSFQQLLRRQPPNKPSTSKRKQLSTPKPPRSSPKPVFGPSSSAPSTNTTTTITTGSVHAPPTLTTLSTGFCKHHHPLPKASHQASHQIHEQNYSLSRPSPGHEHG